MDIFFTFVQPIFLSTKIIFEYLYLAAKGTYTRPGRFYKLKPVSAPAVRCPQYSKLFHSCLWAPLVAPFHGAQMSLKFLYSVANCGMVVVSKSKINEMSKLGFHWATVP